VVYLARIKKGYEQMIFNSLNNYRDAFEVLIVLEMLIKERKINEYK